MSQSILAKVGINALVDEATGYQNVRDTNALSELLKLYVAEDLLRRESGFLSNTIKSLSVYTGLTATRKKLTSKRSAMLSLISMCTTLLSMPTRAMAMARLQKS